MGGPAWACAWRWVENGVNGLEIAAGTRRAAGEDAWRLRYAPLPCVTCARNHGGASARADQDEPQHGIREADKGIGRQSDAVLG